MIGEEIAIRWSDGSESYFPTAKLREHCPCAVCAGEADILGNLMKPEVQLTQKSFQLKNWEIIGAYAWQPTWGDGHRTGLYSFKFLKQLETVWNSNP